MNERAASQQSVGLVLAILWALFTVCQLPGVIAPWRFDPDRQGVRTAAGPAWERRQPKRVQTLALHATQGEDVIFVCAPPACSLAGVADGLVAQVSWIVAPVREFGGDALVPLKIVQRGAPLYKSTADDMVAREERLAWTLPGLAQALLVVGGGWMLHDRRRADARRAALSREAAERKRAR